MKRRLWYLLMLGACFLSIAIATVDEHAYDQALSAMHKQDWFTATTLLEQHPTGPDPTLLSYLLAVCWYYRADTGKALDYASSAIRGRPPLQEPYATDATKLVQHINATLAARHKLEQYEKATFSLSMAPPHSKDFAESAAGLTAGKKTEHQMQMRREQDIARPTALDPLAKEEPLQLAIPSGSK
ncbi:exported protein of unknown function [Ralstonia solanacearum CMR15]|uniref:hypothetical protein n=1 Tax=Ralstonia pseudosolanacearum TaxID=1310165 RepID=UPI0001D9482F|nr:hypothetical protein [Ralstonia pseudosolanacearum]CBJ38820.1 exported protein of unknown function [Ralstonia solanacearum CMR15]